MEYMLMPLRRYADFSGRSRRTEFWMFVLFQFLIGMGVVVLMMVLGGAAVLSGDPSQAMAMGGIILVLYLLLALVGLAFLIPNLAVTVRRLHDTDRSGWWILIGIIPIVGWILIIVWFCTDSKADNKYGPNPKTGPAGYEGGYPPPPPPAYGSGGQYGG